MTETYEAVEVYANHQAACGHRHRTEEAAWRYCGTHAAYVRPVWDEPDTIEGQRAIAERRA